MCVSLCLECVSVCLRRPVCCFCSWDYHLGIRCLAQDTIRAKDAIIAAEFAVLTTLEFDLEIQHPIASFRALIDAMALRAWPPLYPSLSALPPPNGVCVSFSQSWMRRGCCCN